MLRIVGHSKFTNSLPANVEGNAVRTQRHKTMTNDDGGRKLLVMSLC